MSCVGGIPPPFPGALKRGDCGAGIKLLQEFLCLSGYDLELDGIFGAATEFALMEFQQSHGKARRYLKASTWGVLTKKVSFALRELDVSDRAPLEAVAVAYADRHLMAKAQELKAKNLGPWVRLYMDDLEGYSWCAGFLSFCIKQAGLTKGVDVSKLPNSVSCDEIAIKWGRDYAKLKRGSELKSINPGAIFLLRKSEHDWIHTGFVLKQKENMILTIEGNTNMAGQREGVAVMRRIRKLTDSIDIINNYS